MSNVFYSQAPKLELNSEVMSIDDDEATFLEENFNL